MKIKTKVCLPIIMVLFLASCNQKENNTRNNNDSRIINVKTVKIVSYEGENIRNYSGVLDAKDILPVSFATSGSVIRVLVDVGESVKKGQLLAELNPSNAQNIYALSNAKLEQAQDAYNRLKPMQENGTLPEIKWIEVKTGLNQAKAATEIAKKGVTDTRLYAPVSGVIGKKKIQAGMNILPINTVLEILNINTVNARASVPENEINYLKIGDIATIYISAIDKSFTGSIEEIGVSADLFSHSYPVKITIQNPDNLIKPGMVCSIKIQTTSNQKGFLVSNKTLQVGLDGQFIYINKNNVAHKKSVITIALIDQDVLIDGDFKEGDEIIISGQQKLREGSNINVLK